MDVAVAPGSGKTEDLRVARSRAAVLSVAVDLLVEGGAPAVTVEAVVQRSGVARSTIYRHWPRRIDMVADTFRTLIPPLPTVPSAGDVRARLQGVLHGLASQMNEEKYAALVPAVLDSATRDPELAEFREAFARSQRAPLDAVLRDAIRTGELPEGVDNDGAISALVGPLFFRRVILAQPVDDDFADRLIDAFLENHRH